MRLRAFTLIELLVVIAIIAVLMAVLMPSLRMAKDHAKRVHCVSNTKTLALGWYMYQDDFNGKLVPAHTQDNPIQWVGQEPANGTWDQKKDSIRRGLLYPFVGKSVDIFHSRPIPEDPRPLDQPPFGPSPSSAAPTVRLGATTPKRHATRKSKPPPRNTFWSRRPIRGATTWVPGR